MTVLRAYNTFEGGVAETTITTGNSGGASGDAFASVSNAIFDQAAPFPLSYDLNINYSPTFPEFSGVGNFHSRLASGVLRYTDTEYGDHIETNLDFIYRQAADDVSGNFSLICFAVDSFIVGGLRFQIRRTDRKVQLLDDGGGGGPGPTSTTVIPLDTYVRFNATFRINEANPAASHIRCAIHVATFDDPDWVISSVPDEELVWDGASCFDGSFNQFNIQTNGSVGDNYWIDNLIWYQSPGDVSPGDVDRLLSTVDTIDHDLLFGVHPDNHHAEAHPLAGPEHVAGFETESGTSPTISDGDFTTTPDNGTMATTYNTGTGQKLLWIRSNGTWDFVEVT